MYSSIPKAIEELKKGNLIIIIDETREKEADLMLAGEFVSEEKIAFILRYSCGIITVPLTRKRAQELELSLMVENNSDKHCTNFTVSVDSNNSEMKTGVSAKDRARTILTIVSGTAKELARPGHIFPLIARDSLLERQGHTESSLALCELAGLQKVAVICELMHDDGTMMGNDAVFQFAEKMGLCVVSIRQIVDFVQK